MTFVWRTVQSSSSLLLSFPSLAFLFFSPVISSQPISMLSHRRLDRVVDLTTENLFDAVMEETGRQGVDIILQTVPSTQPIPTTFVLGLSPHSSEARLCVNSGDNRKTGAEAISSDPRHGIVTDFKTSDCLSLAPGSHSISGTSGSMGHSVRAASGTRMQIWNLTYPDPLVVVEK